MTAIAAFRSMYRAVLGLLLMALTMPASAALRDEDNATAAGLALVQTAAQGSLEEAFRTANELRRPNDAKLASALDVRQKFVSEQLGRLGAQDGEARLVEATPYFAGCIGREYLVRYAGGEQRWLLKFRKARGGWALFDLEVKAAPAA